MLVNTGSGSQREHWVQCSAAHPLQSVPWREPKATAEGLLVAGAALAVAVTAQHLTCHQCKGIMGLWQVGKRSCFSWRELGHPQAAFYWYELGHP